MSSIFVASGFVFVEMSHVNFENNGKPIVLICIFAEILKELFNI